MRGLRPPTLEEAQQICLIEKWYESTSVLGAKVGNLGSEPGRGRLVWAFGEHMVLIDYDDPIVYEYGAERLLKEFGKNLSETTHDRP